MVKIACVFPGQGAQQVGMGSDLLAQSAEAKKKFSAADTRLGYALTDLIMNGPEDQLTLTENTQPAILAVSCILYDALRLHGLSPDYVAGHSLGEYSALYAAGVFSFEDAIFAVRQRGLLMEQAVPAGAGTMAAVLGLAPDALEAICQKLSSEGQAVQLANLNAPGQIVISGSAAGVSQASALANAAGARRVVPLAVSGPFHSSLMKPAAEAMRAVLANLRIHDAQIPVIANCSADAETEASIICDNLISQLYSPVRWVESVERLKAAGVDTYIEVGPGRVLSGLIKKIHRGARILSVHDLASLDDTIAQLKEAAK
ncbi:MAG: ACP S-malonyltransferase [Sporolactobacillus sp.]